MPLGIDLIITLRTESRIRQRLLRTYRLTIITDNIGIIVSFCFDITLGGTHIHTQVEQFYHT